MRRGLWLAILMGCAEGDDLGLPDDTSVDDTTFRVVLTADPHIIGDNYGCDPFPPDKGCESSREDTESLYRSRRRARFTRDVINDLSPRPEAVFVAGDIMHANYAFGTDLEAYRSAENGSAAYQAKQIYDGYDVPVHLGWGNHDYGDDRAFSQRIFREIFETEPYYAVEIGGWKFLVLDSQYATEVDPMTQFITRVDGALGREQLAWVAEELAEGVPTMILAHHHPLVGTLKENEDPDGPWPDLYAVVEAHSDVVQGLFFGHLHRWVDVKDFFGGVPSWVLGAIRYDADNFWVFEFETDGGSYEVLDFDKAGWGSVNGYSTDYGEDGSVTVDLSSDPADDPAGPWEGDWADFPPPWPPADE